ncbi:MAG: VWA domain-containing protein [Ahniella sp.]|nr:VWA domain-containing protein [Ahniella sp.]
MSRPTRLFRTLLATCVLSAASSVPAAIPDDEPNLEDLLMSANGLYQLRYSDNQFSPHYMPASQVQFAADALDRSGTSSTGFPLGHHAGFANLGLRAPFFLGGVRDVTFWDCKDPEDEEAFDCDNGFAVLEQIIMPSPTYRARSSSCIRMIIGHELFHHVEFAYTNAGGGSGCGETFGITACEGQARAMQDKVYSDLDLSPGSSCIAGFQTEVNAYLGSPDRDLWSSGYASALFWTYLMEQYGTFNEEPYRGADFITAWWELAEDRVADPDVYGITADTIKLFEPDATLLNTYHDFTIANLLKDFTLSGIPADARARYSYIDELPHLNQNNLMKFNAVKMTATATVGANQTGTLDFDAQQFGGDYLRFNVGSCPAGNTLEFQLKPDPTTPNPTPTTQALISLVLVKAPNVPVRLYKWRANTAKVSAVQPVGTPYQQAYFIVAGRNGHYAGRATAQCKPGPLAPIVQFAGVQNPQAPSGSRLGTVHVQVPDGAAPNNSVIGLSASDLRVRVGGVDAVVESFVPQGDGYRLRFRQPALSGPGPFPVAVDIGTQSTTLANAIRIDDPKPEVAFVLDLTSSMPTQAMLLPAVQKIREAAARMSTQSRVAVIGFAGNGVEPDLDATVLLPLAPLSASQRGTLESVLGSLSASTQSAGAPGDGVQAAIDQFTAQGGTGPKSIVLMTDGGIGEGRGLADLLPALRAGGIAVHVIAFGPRTDQPFLDRLARSTGGTFHYIPTFAAGPEAAGG